jgi:uncharacterized protein
MSAEPGLALAPEDIKIPVAQSRVCPKCSYSRRPTDTAPPWQCPRCEVAYDKVAAPPSVAQRAAKREEKAAQSAARKRTGPAAWVLVAMLAAGAAWWGVGAWRAKYPSAAERAARAEAQARSGRVDAAMQEQQVLAQLKEADDHLRMARTEQALAILNRYAAQGNPRAMVSLAIVYRDGYRVPADLPKAMDLLEKAAADAYAPAFVHLGYASETGKGRPQNYEEAVNQYTKAARLGNMTGLYCLGIIHAQGVPGIPPNPVLAHILLDLSHRAFMADPSGESQAPGQKSVFSAQGELRKLAEKMSPVDVVKAREWADAWRPGQPFPG